MRLRLVLIGVVLGGCGAAVQKETRAPVAAAPAPAAVEAPPAREEIVVQGELGTLEQSEIDATVDKRRAAIDACYQAGLARAWYLGGALELKLRLAVDGAVKSAWMARGLGSLAVERCLLEVARGLRFPPPRGHAEAEFSYPLAFRGKAQLREWTNVEVAATFEKHQAALDACAKKGSVPPSLRVTVFVGPGGKAGPVGLGADAAIEEPYGSCVAAAVARWKFDDPRGRIARATYEF